MMLVGEVQFGSASDPGGGSQVPHTSQLWAYESVSDKCVCFLFPVIFRLEVIILAKREVREKKIGFLLFPEHCCILRLEGQGAGGSEKGSF